MSVIFYYMLGMVSGAAICFIYMLLKIRSEKRETEKPHAHAHAYALLESGDHLSVGGKFYAVKTRGEISFKAFKSELEEVKE
ncbi:hypothetical protein KAR91_28275 [Candidatus Pacearchaeota archaeon]|nr:hypothetical protein [Candidatus Pacearchaeota archaeon]